MRFQVAKIVSRIQGSYIANSLVKFCYLIKLIESKLLNVRNIQLHGRKRKYSLFCMECLKGKKLL
jgi:hypothetical protein